MGIVLGSMHRTRQQHRQALARAARVTVEALECRTLFSRILLIGSDDADALSSTRAALLSSPPMADDTIDTFDSRAATPTLAVLNSYDAVLNWTNYPPGDSVGLGNVLASYVDGGGHVLLSTYSQSVEWGTGGRIQDPGYSPFDVAIHGTSYGGGLTTYHSLTGYDAATGYFAGLTAAPVYWANVNYVNAPLDAGAQLLASDNYGNKVMAANASGNVLAIMIYPGFRSGYTTDRNTYRLFANTLDILSNHAPTADAGAAYTVAEGSTIQLVGSGSDSDGTVATYQWDLNYDGQTFHADASGPTATFTAAELDGPSTRTVALRVGDNRGVYSRISTATVSVTNVAPAFDLGADQTIDADSLGVFGRTDLAFDDPGPDAWTATVDYGDGDGTQSLKLTGKTFELDHLYSASGVYTVTVTISDDDGGSWTDSFDLTANLNTAPQAAAGDSYTVDEGGQIVLSAAGTSDAQQAASTLTYAWDFDGDGEFDDATGISPVFTAAGLDGPTAVTVAVRVIDAGGLSATDSAVVTVRNLAPVLQPLQGPDVATPGQPVSVLAAFADAGAADTHVTLIDWGDGVIDSGAPAESAGSGQAAGNHIYSALGTYTITLTVTDDEGAASSVTRQVIVKRAILQPDSANPSLSMLVVGGSNAADAINIGPGTNGVEVFLGGVSQGTFAASGRIVVYGLSGNDSISVAGSVPNQVWLYGDDGADQLNLGNAGGIAFGGDGNDVLRGGNGRDILIGGRGSDDILGNSGDDILIAGYTAFDTRLGYRPLLAQPQAGDGSAHEQAWAALLAEWSRQTAGTASYQQRVANLSGGTVSGAGAANMTADRVNGVYFLKTDGTTQTVFDDGVGDQVDLLNGAGGSDWFLANVANDGGTLDKIQGSTSGEFRSDIDAG